MADAYLITGAMGCIGAWTIYHLVKQGKQVVSFDLSDNRSRLDLLLSREEQNAIRFVSGDLTDFNRVLAAYHDHNITHVVHLAALQVPFVRANPVVGAQVNVTGTVNVFEAAKQSNVKHLAYASSIAVYGAPEDYPPGVVAADAPKLARTLYGVFKIADEGIARIYYQDYGISSSALRPYTIYGLGRDQGLTSEPTKAMQAAAKGEDFHISFGGAMQFHFASDVALQFIECAEKPLAGAFVFNLGTPSLAVRDVTKLIMDAAPGVTITCGDNQLPFPPELESAPLYKAYDTVYETPLAEGIRQTIEGFQRVSA